MSSNGSHNGSGEHIGDGFDTRSVHGGRIEDGYGSVVTPIYQTSIFEFPDAETGGRAFSEHRSAYIYTRWGNPTIDALEAQIASLEGGAAAYSFGTGIAAINFLYFALLGAGKHVVVGESIYGPTRVALDAFWSRFGVEHTVVDTYDLEAVRAAMRPNTALVHIESPANPNLRITNIRACADIAHEHGALLSIDSTLASPVLQRPIEHGADIVMHSVTKFLNGHSDTLGGILVFKDRELREGLYKQWHTFGASMDPHQAWLILRGIKTLRPRVLQAQSNAIALANFLDAHPAVQRVHYPGLASHEGAEIHARQADGPGALISFELRGGIEAGKTLLDNMHVATLAVSLGGVDTLIQHPASMTHHILTREQRLAANIADGLIRLSVGIEDWADLLADFEQALGKVKEVVPVS
jgi:methionine-gamma-lyase